MTLRWPSIRNFAHQESLHSSVRKLMGETDFDMIVVRQFDASALPLTTESVELAAATDEFAIECMRGFFDMLDSGGRGRQAFGAGAGQQIDREPFLLAQSKDWRINTWNALNTALNTALIMREYVPRVSCSLLFFPQIVLFSNSDLSCLR